MRVPRLWSMRLSPVGWIMEMTLLYGLPTEYLIAKLQVVLNCAARLILCKQKYDHATPLLIQLHWLPVSQRIIFKILLLTFTARNGIAPTYLTELLDRGYWRFLSPILSMATDHFPSVHYLHFGIAYQIIWDLQLQLLTYVLLSMISRLSCFTSPDF